MHSRYECLKAGLADQINDAGVSDDTLNFSRLVFLTIQTAALVGGDAEEQIAARHVLEKLMARGSCLQQEGDLSHAHTI